jgi:RNA polymerase sigma-70 factor (ECF subfamily)
VTNVADMTEAGWLVERFEEHRPQLRAVAYRMLGSLSEADDAVQDAWLRVSRADTSGIENLRGYLTTVVARVCLNLLRARRAHPSEPLEGRLPDFVVAPVDEPAGGADPQQQLLLADAVGLAMLVVLDRLAPAERVAFVLHDVFGVPFAEIGEIVDRSPAAARQLASRARRRVRGGSPAAASADPARQRAIVDAFLAAGRAGDFAALLALLDPDVVVRADFGTTTLGRQVIRGREAVAQSALGFGSLARFARPALVNGTPGLVVIREAGPFAVLAFTLRDGRVVEMDILGDPKRLAALDLAAFAG